MKRIIIAAFLALTSITVSATDQINDKVIINDEEWEMPLSPLLSLDGDAYDMFNGLLGERNFASTALLRGYRAYWHVGKRGLYLDKVEVLQSNGRMKEIEMPQLKKALKKYRDRGKIRAEWLTAEVTVMTRTGSVQERILDIRKGLIKNL